MKREHNEYDWRQEWPIFTWVLCFFCRKEYRLEWGWWRVNPGVAIFSICRKCAPTKEDATCRFNEYQKKTRPNPPKGGILNCNMSKSTPVPPSKAGPIQGLKRKSIS